MNLLYGSIATALVVVIGFFIAQCLPLKWSRVSESPVIYVVYGAVYLTLVALTYYLLRNFVSLLTILPISKSADFESFLLEKATGIYLYALLSSIAWPLVLNKWLFSKQPYRFWLAEKMAHNKLDRLFIRALRESKLVCLVLDTGKVYVGWVTELPLPNDDKEYVYLVPLQSGYKSDKHLFVFNVYHEEVMREGNINAAGYIGSPKSVSRASIKTANLFDLDLYDQFEDQAKQAS